MHISVRNCVHPKLKPLSKIVSGLFLRDSIRTEKKGRGGGSNEWKDEPRVLLFSINVQCGKEISIQTRALELRGSVTTTLKEL